MKAAVEEHFEMKGGKASWKNRSEKGNQAVASKAFYLPLNAPPEFGTVLVLALLKAPGRKLALLPAGEASIEKAGKVKTDKGEFTEYRITGLSFTPQSVWLDRKGIAASVSSWFSVVPEGLEPAIPQLLTAQEKTTAAWSERIARALAHSPSGDLVICNTRLFDPGDLSVTPGTSALVRGDRIVRVGPDADIKPSAGAEIIDAKGRFLMPGLWDNHQHLADSEGALSISPAA